jgi:hypothetical protein
MIVEELDMSKETVRKILVQDLGTTSKLADEPTPRISLWEPAVLAYHCRELAVLAYMQKKKA